MDKIELVPVEWLAHHPDNPRKDLGDLTELAESIKANGILQNLTIVASEDENEGDGTYKRFWVVIGNRRFEAAQMAGLTEVPCVISEMDRKTQVATMLQENMQRADLTVYEQAQGFQMMMDLGFNEDQISERTGFSKTTVKRRLKMAELDQKQLKKACTGEHDRQITLHDFERLAQIDSIKQRNALLKEIGESNFNWSLNRALKVQQANKNKPEIKKVLKEAGATPIQQNERYGAGYEGHWEWKVEMDKWKPGDKIIPKINKELFYFMDDTDISFYTKAEKKKAEKVERPKEEIEADKARAKAWKQIDDDTKTADDLRKAFVANLKMTPKNAPVMLTFFMKAVVLREIEYSVPREELKKLFGIEKSSWTERMPETAKAVDEWDISDIPKVIGCIFDGEERISLGYVDGVKSRDFPKYKKNYVLDAYYDWLTAYGYQLSDTERQLMEGTHECYKEGAGS